MRLFNFKQKYRYGGNRVTIKRSQVNLKKIDSFQLLKLDEDLKELHHINKMGNVVCIVVDGWAEAEVDGKIYFLEKNQGILFEPGEKHKIVKGKGIMLSLSSEDYDTKLGTIWNK